MQSMVMVRFGITLIGAKSAIDRGANLYSNKKKCSPNKIVPTSEMKWIT